jgi:hypothetical protein
MADSKQSQPKKHTHSAFGFQRQGKRWGVLLDCGTGYLDFGEDTVEALAARFQLDPAIVREILTSATAHLFINRQIYPGATGYYCLRARKQLPPPWVEERAPEPFDGPLPPEHLR